MVMAILLSGIAIFFLLFTVLSGLMGQSAAITRLKKYTDKNEITREDVPRKKDPYKSGLGFLARGIEKSGLFHRYKENMRKKLIKANLLLKPEEMVSIAVVALLLGGILGYFLSNNIVFAVILAFAGMNIPGFIVSSRIRKRLKTINHQLGDTIAILSNSLKAGHSFFQAVDSLPPK